MGRCLLALVLVGCSYDPQGVPAAPDGLSVGNEPPADAFVPASCPQAYVAITGEISRYRLIDSDGDFRTQHDNCKSDGGHLAVYQSVAERDTVRSQISSDDLWVGAVQAPSQSAPELGWSNLTGGEVLAALWESGVPNDDDDHIENNEQNVALQQSGGLDDKSHTETHRAVCECDGHAIDPSVEAQIPQ